MEEEEEDKAEEKELEEWMQSVMTHRQTIVSVHTGNFLQSEDWEKGKCNAVFKLLLSPPVEPLTQLIRLCVFFWELDLYFFLFLFLVCLLPCLCLLNYVSIYLFLFVWNFCFNTFLSAEMSVWTSLYFFVILSDLVSFLCISLHFFPSLFGDKNAEQI